jgi:hypothetical protein
MWSALGGEPSLTRHLTVSAAGCVLLSVFAVDDLAAARVGVASVAVAELLAARDETALPAVDVSRRHASAAFIGELLFSPEGWERPPASPIPSRLVRR